MKFKYKYIHYYPYLCAAMNMKRFIYVILFLLSTLSLSAQNWSVDWQAETDYMAGTGDYLPFWARTGRNGIVPYSSSALAIGGADLRYKAENGLHFDAGVNLVGSLESRNPVHQTRVKGIVDRLYVSGGWRMMHLDIGMKPFERELSDLSITGGNILLSDNARNIPGINARLDWVYFERGHWFGFKGNYGHYEMIDNRYVTGTKLHNKSLMLKLAAGRKVDLIFGVDHWAQWGGVSPSQGPQPSSFKDYLRILFVQAGGEDATVSDQVNILGNHLGREVFRVDWRARPFTMTFQYDMPFEDNGGIKRLQNFPDGVWSLRFDLNDKEAFVTEVVAEFINTTWQAGDKHDRPATPEEMEKQDPDDYYYGKIVIGGMDNYFNNGTYQSGWTNYGRVIGLPLILPGRPNKDGVVTGIVNNRVRAYHIGLRGNLLEGVPYTFRSTYSSNWGRYNIAQSSFFYDRPWQISLALEVELGRNITNLPLVLTVGAYGDIGKLYQNSAGLTLRIAYKDSHRF